MSAQPQPYHVEPDSELWTLLDQAEVTPVLVEKDGKRFRIVREVDDIWAGYDPDAAIAGMERAAGGITPEEAERRIAQLYEAREAGTRPITRP
jgi:hypothetical protein